MFSTKLYTTFLILNMSEMISNHSDVKQLHFYAFEFTYFSARQRNIKRHFDV